MNSLTWKIGKALAIVSIGLIVLLFVFQVQLLEPMYEQSKIATVKRVSDEIVYRLEHEEDWSEELYQISLENDVCIRILGEEPTNMTVGNMGCPLYRINSFELIELISEAQSEGNASLSKDHHWMAPGGEMKSIVYTRILENESQDVVMVYSGISPVDATINTLKKQILYIGGIVILTMALLTLWLNRKIAKPLVEINASAKELSNGNYVQVQNANHYLEAEELNETLIQAAQDIQKADQAKRDLISNVSHDLRTPLTMIQGYGEMMLDLPDENKTENIEVIVQESKRLKYLVNDLLDLSKLQSHQIELHCTKVNLSKLVEEEVKKYLIYQQDGYSISMDIEEDLYSSVDEQRFRQVINNFISNAINYSTNNKEIYVSVKKKDSNIRLEVQDYGQGISKEDLPMIWDRYYKVDKQHIRVQEGSGIGLSIVKEILDLHHAQYGVISEVDQGSTFWVELSIEQ